MPSYGASHVIPEPEATAFSKVLARSTILDGASTVVADEGSEGALSVALASLSIPTGPLPVHITTELRVEMGDTS